MSISHSSDTETSATAFLHFSMISFVGTKSKHDSDILISRESNADVLFDKLFLSLVFVKGAGTPPTQPAHAKPIKVTMED